MKASNALSALTIIFAVWVFYEAVTPDSPLVTQEAESRASTDHPTLKSINNDAGAALSKYLEGFANQDIPWYDSIDTVRVEGSTAIAREKVHKDPEGVCRGLSGYVFGRNPFGLDSVKVEVPSGIAIIYRRTKGDLCVLTN